MAEFYTCCINCFPGSNQPIPEVMTAEEACCYLRLDLDRSMENAIKALNRLVDRKLIRPCMYGRERRYTKKELDRFLMDQTEIYGEVA